MAKLGEAYVRVRADLEPFGKDLDRGLKTITDKFEKALNRQFGKNLGGNVGKGISEGFGDATKDIGNDLGKRLRVPANNRRVGRQAGKEFGDGYGEGVLGGLKRIAGLTITALEDGFSSLPPQVKGVVGAALIAALVPAGAFAGAALGAAIIGGTVGIGIALSSQFQEVEDRFLIFAERLRQRAVDEARPFAGEVIASLDFFDTELDRLDPKIRDVFANAARYVEPFSRGVAGAVDGLVTGLDEGFKNADFENLSNSIEAGLTEIGVVTGEAVDKILSNPNLAESLDDLLETLGDLVEVGGAFLDWSISAWSSFKQGVSVVGDFFGALTDVANLIGQISKPGDNFGERVGDSWDQLVYRFTGGGDAVVKQFGWIDQANRAWNNTTSETIKKTEEQEKAIKELNAALEAQKRLVNDLIGTQIDYQAAIDQTIDDFKEYGTSLDLGNEKGRRNAENIQRQINALQDQVKAQVEAGELTDAEAQKFYDREIARLRSEFKARGGNLKQFDELFAKLIALQTAPPVPNKLGPFAAALAPIVKALREIEARAQAIREQGLPSTHNKSGVGPGQQKYAAGGFINEPTNAIMGENYKPEVVLPLTDTRRSLQLLSRSSLAGMLGGGTNVAVYIGNEQLDARMFSVAQTSNKATARAVSQTPRMV